MPKPLGQPNARGDYSVEKGGHRFWLGSERREAEQRKLLIEKLWDVVKANQGWADRTKEMGRCIARGDKFVLDSDNPHEFMCQISKKNLRPFSGVAFW